MVSKEDDQEVKSPQEGEKPPQEDLGIQKKEEITGENKQKSEIKKGEQVAFPLGTHSKVSLVKKVIGTSPEDKDPPPEKGGGKQNITDSLEGGQKPPPEKKEDVMPLDNEGEQFVVKQVRKHTEPIEERLSTIHDEMKTGMDALREVVKKINTTTPPTPQAKIPTKQELIEGTKEALKKEEGERRKRLEEDQRTKDREEKLKKVYDYCFSNPESTECKTLPDYLKKRLEEALKKAPQETGEKKPDIPAARTPLEAMTEERRKTLTEEQNKDRDAEVAERLKTQNITSNDIFRQFDETDLDNIRKKPTMRDPIVEALTPDELAKAVGIRCTDEACQVKFREGGIAVLQKDKDGRWNAVDKEIAKEMKPLF